MKKLLVLFVLLFLATFAVATQTVVNPYTGSLQLINADGPQGIAGPIGPTGEAGSVGTTGEAGPIGPRGSGTTVECIDTGTQLVFLDVLNHVVTSAEALGGGFYIPWSKTTANKVVGVVGTIYINGNGQDTVTANNSSYYIINYQGGTNQWQVAGGIASSDVWSILIYYLK